MTTQRQGAPPPPEQIAAGGPPANISIIRERVVDTQPVPGQVQQLVAVTYRIPPNSPQIVFVPLEQLPHWAWMKDHPGQAVPPAVQAQGDQALREIIRRQPQAETARPRTI